MANFLPKSDREFRVGHGCCSSSSPDDGERRRRRSDLDGDDIAESSAAARRHSRLLSRWVARQTEDIITTIERRNRESELLALTSLHTVLESSFLRPPPQPPSSAQPTPAPTPISAASSILRRWRELEDEARASGRSASPSSSSSREQSPESGESERVREIIRGMTESARVSPESPRAEWLGETERERVRHVREWVQTATQRRDDERERRRREDSTPPGDALRIRGRQARLDLIMRIVRERQRELQGLQEHRAVSDFAHRNRIQSFLRGRFLRNGRPVEDERSPSVAARELGQLQQRNPVSGLRREGFHYGLENIVHGQASSVLDSSTRTNSSGSRNDQSQLTSTVELSSENHVEYQSRSESSDILQTIQEHATAEFEGTIPNESTDWQESATRENWQEVDTEQGESDWQHPSEIGFSEWQDGTREESEVNWQENIDQEWSRETPEDEEDEESHILEENDEWHENDAHENVENWEGGPSDPPRDQHSVPLRRVGRFILPDDDNVYSIELRELLSRRSVSNLLRSGFRESLDQLIQSYVERQGHTPLDWHLERQLPSPDSPEQDQGLGRGEPHQEHQGVARPPFVLSSPPVPPPQPLWHSGLRHSNWTRQSMHRPEIEWDIINDLRADMAKLQQGMSHMQRMLEACMDMQLELQRAVRQEVSAALNRSTDGKGLGEETSDYGSKWGHVRKGTCCVCCDSHIDALLYRCGHMCTCSKCANELVRGGGKCPLCRAPIVEVIRAYSIL